MEVISILGVAWYELNALKFKLILKVERTFEDLIDAIKSNFQPKFSNQFQERNVPSNSNFSIPKVVHVCTRQQNLLVSKITFVKLRVYPPNRFSCLLFIIIEKKEKNYSYKTVQLSRSAPISLFLLTVQIIK